MDGGTLEYIFETDAQDVPKTVSKEKAAEIAADFVTTFYHAQIGALETREFRITHSVDPVRLISKALRPCFRVLATPSLLTSHNHSLLI